jgi:hypothetical protein
MERNLREGVGMMPQSGRMILLGASGKLGRMMLAIAGQTDLQQFEMKPVYRSKAVDAKGVIWQPGQDPGGIGPADVVVALWGVTGGNLPALEANETLALHAQALAEAVGASCVIHCSSAAVYQPGAGLLSEDATCAPPSPYGAAKLAMERALEGAPGAVWMRIGNVAGAESLFGNMRPGGRIRLDRFPDGASPARSYIAPHDLADVIAALARSDMTGPVNVGAPCATQMGAIASEVGVGIDWVDAPDSALPLVGLDTTQLSRVIALPDSAADPAHLVASARATGVWP